MRIILVVIFLFLYLSLILFYKSFTITMHSIFSANTFSIVTIEKFYKSFTKSAFFVLSCYLLLAVLALCSCVRNANGVNQDPVISSAIVADKDNAEKKKSTQSDTSKNAVTEAVAENDANNPPKASTTTNKKLKPKHGKAQKILETAYTQIGRMYRYGGSSPRTGFDCSGFTRWVFAQNGIKLPRSSGEQLYAGKPVSKKNLRPGDLLIYSRRIGRRRGTHVGIYVGNGKFIHSPRTGHRIQVSDAFDHYRTPRFIAARRVIEDPGAAPLPAEEQKYLAEQALKRNKPKHEPPKLHENTFAESYKIYRVRPGDTISGLAKRYHVSTRRLLAANQLKKRDVLQLNQRLMIPMPGGSSGRIVKPGQSRPEISNVVKHTVKRGESLGVIAQKYGVSSKAIARANRLRSKDAIRAGQKLIIPGKQAASAKPDAGNAVEHTVKRGEFLGIIAQKYGVSSKAIARANRLRSKHAIRAGQKLVIPGKQAERAVTAANASEVEDEIIVSPPRKASDKKQKDSPISKSAAKPKRTSQPSEEDILVAKAEVEEDILVAPPSQATSYTVKSGDTIWEISKKFGISESSLLAANNLKKKHTLRLGQRLVIPKKNSGKAQKTDKKTTRAQQTGKTYVVKSGDTIWKIARQHGLSESALLHANKLSKKHVLRLGQKLVIP